MITSMKYRMNISKRRGWLSFYALMIVVILGFYIAGTQISSIDQSQSYRLKLFETQASQAADSALAYALRDTAGNTGVWSDMAVPGNPQIPRADTIAIWTGATGNPATENKMIVWGGKDRNDTLTKFGGIYDPETNSWTLINDAGAPEERTNHSVLWTGNTGNPATANKLIVWGGINGSNDYIKTGGVYDPAAPAATAWTATKTGGAPTGRSDHAAAWTGNEMIIWGGRDGGGPNDKLDNGRRYDPITDSWSNLSSLNAPSKRASASTVWTGSEMIIWGGEGAQPPQPVNTGARYNPVTNSWQPMNTINAPSKRAFCSTIWTGSEMIVWGGYKNPSPHALGDGGIYNPALDDGTNEPWREIPENTDVPTRRDNAAVWIDGTMALWGGKSKPAAGPNQAVNSGCAMRASCGHWGLITGTNAPSPRYGPISTWTGKYMLIWGGRGNADNVINDGKRWLPPPAASSTFELTADSAQIATISMSYLTSSNTPALVTVSSSVFDRNGREYGGRTAQRCLDVERHRYNKGCWTRP